MSENEKKDLSKINRYFVYHCNLIFLSMCFGVHIFYSLFFGIKHMPIMSGINAISVLCYIVFFFTEKKNDIATMMAVYVEIYLYSCVATKLLGFESSFYLYVFGMMFLSNVFFQNSRKSRIASYLLGVVALVFCMFSDCFLWFDQFSYQYTMNEIGFGLRLINCAITCATIIYMTLVYTAQVQYSKVKFQYMAEHDALSGLYSRTYYDAILLCEGEALKENLSVIMIDIDNFKKINDTYGHSIGDEAIKHLAKCLKSSVRENDVIMRWGGEEFVVCLKNCPKENAVTIAEKMRIKASETPYYKLNEKGLYLTITLGVSHSGNCKNIDDLINQADQNLYEGKQSGKNVVVSN